MSLLTGDWGKTMSQMHKKSHAWDEKKQTNLIILIIVVVFAATTIWSGVAMRRQLKENADVTNYLLAENCKSAEETELTTYETMLNMLVAYVEKNEEGNKTSDEIGENLHLYLQKFYQLYAEEQFRCSCVLEGHLISNDEVYEQAAADQYDFRSSEWYQQALLSGGEIYATSAYSDPLSGDLIMTLAKKSSVSDNVFAIDVFFDHYHNDTVTSLPENAAYYLFDNNSTIVYSKTQVFDDYTSMQSFMGAMLWQNEEELYASGKVVLDYTDAKGIKRTAYITRLSNDWKVILTIPQSNAIAGVTTLYFTIGMILLIGTAIIALLSMLFYQQRKRRQEAQKTVDVMGRDTEIYKAILRNTIITYRRIYYVNLENEGYERIYPEETDGTYKGVYRDIITAHFIGEAMEDAGRQEIEDFFDLEKVKAALAENEYCERRCQYYDAAGNGETCTATFVALNRQDGSVTDVTLIVRSIEDLIAEENRKNELLTMAVDRAEAASHAKSDFLSNMSHDIRTPLNAILGMTAIAAMHIDNKERVLDALAKITSSGKHLLGLINSVLDMSKIESGKISLNEEEFKLSDTIQSLLDLFYDQTQKKNIDFTVNVEKIEHEDVIGDGQRLQQIFVNILGNSLKFTPEGGKISMGISERPSNLPGKSCYRFVFEDTGIGMSQDFVDRIFEPFVRAEDSRIDHIEGSGLGMSIAVNIARMMGGDIEVESELGKGSRFTVTVYMKINNVTEEDIKRLASLSVLVVDDEEIACENACEILNSLDMKAEYAMNGDDAVARVVEVHEQAEDFELIILDWKMPGKDGIQTTREIRKVMGDDIPIIVLSAYDWSDIEQEALAAGVNAFISKPLFKSKLVHVIKEVVGLYPQEETQLVTAEYKKRDVRILLADDVELNLEVALEFLRHLGVEADTALDGKETVDKFAAQPAGFYDMIFMDIHMPVMDGYEATRVIRGMEREDAQTIPIIAVTADAFSDDIQKANDAGMNGHIAKPLSIDALNREIEKWTEK
jgi:signal transduction histidine kinase/CheY-like chemotaxis protein